MRGASPSLQALIEPVVSGLGYEWVGAQQSANLLRVFIDREEGISVEDCEAVSHQLSGVLDVADPIASRYCLEVSSPGLDRPLFLPAHYERFVGSQLKLRLTTPYEGQRTFIGRLLGIAQGQVQIESEDTEYFLPFDTIEWAHLISQE